VGVAFPEIPEFRLPSGAKALVLTDAHLPRVSVKLALPVGRIHDPDEMLGLTQVVVDMLKEGTRRRSSQEIAEALDHHAVDFDYQVYMEHTILSLTALSSQLDAALEILSDLLQRPAFPAQELVKVKSRWINHILTQRADPGFLANERMFGELFPEHPYSRVSMSPEVIEKIDTSLVREHFEDHFHAQGALLAFGGAFDLEGALGLAQKHLGSWKGHEERTTIPPPQRWPSNRMVLVHRPNSVQSKVMLGARTFPRSDESFLGLKLMNQILGGGASARLFMNLREKRGFTYGIYSYLRSYQGAGALLIGTSVATDKTRESIEEIRKEISLLQDSEVSSEEITRCQAELSGSFLRQLETPYSTVGLELTRRLENLPSEYFKNYLQDLSRLDPESVMGVARSCLLLERMPTVVVADRAQVEDALRGLGEVCICDTEGRLVE
jgi:zinc protease